MDEEVTVHENALEYLSGFSRKYPDKITLAHFNGVGVDPAFGEISERFAPQHWLYHAGTKLTMGITANSTSALVNDASVFEVGNEVVIVNDIDGDWDEYEHARITGISGNFITLERNIWPNLCPEMTDPCPSRSFAGGSYIAAHVTDGPWGDGNLLWKYNFSSSCPAVNGQTCSDVFVDMIVEWFQTGGLLADLDGIQLDIASSSSFKGDVNLDTIEDYGIDNELKDLYAEGLYQMYQELRNQIGYSKLIIADGKHRNQQNAANILDGMESEALGEWGRDVYFVDFSTAINKFTYWDKHNASPNYFSYLNHKSGKENKILNPNFDDLDNQGFEFWNFENDNVNASFTQNGVSDPVIYITGNGSDACSTQLYQTGLLLGKGKSYTVSFRVWVSGPEEIQVKLSNADSQIEYFNKTISLQQGWKTYSFNFTMDENTTDVDGRISFCVGSDALNIAFRSVSMLNRSNNATRLSLGVATVLGVPFSSFHQPFVTPADDNGGMAENLPGIWDEIKMGKENTTNWLGQPVGPMIRLGSQAPDILEGGGVAITDDFFNNWTSESSISPMPSLDNIEKYENYIKFNGDNDSFSKDWIACTFGGLQISGQNDLFIRFKIKTEENPGEFSEKVARQFQFQLEGFEMDDTYISDYAWTYEKNGIFFGLASTCGWQEVAFYYRKPANGGGQIDMRIQFEGAQSFMIKDFTVHEATDAIVREYENGIVLLNPSYENYPFDLCELFPDQPFDRITGHANQQDNVNTGLPIAANSTLVLPKVSGLFLIKDGIANKALKENEDQINTALFTDNLNIKAYPNPFNEQFSIEFETQNNQNIVLEVIDMAGRKVLTKQYETISGYNKLDIQSDSWQSGIYMYNIIGDDINIRGKLIKADL